ncbi:DUF2798 domain-containing protein [Psychrobacter sp. YP14]|uniref:DUF2798 domain-containing protein n=1 Tax=Psychrobacter sp. YP14 TaxID=2203895 RepID=UPI000D7DCCDF|nr:DUF2798 domain-containing protein [Psychrobacter sp. YP14]AWT48140.1 DUF2798 domain-containing protein [Psychrobacter sp. YP14]
MANHSKPSSDPSSKLRIHRKYYRLIFTALMGLFMSCLISLILTYLNRGWFDGFFAEVLSSWGTSFIIAWPCAYFAAYVIQDLLLSRIDFYSDE